MLTHERRALASLIDIAIVLIITLLLNLFLPKPAFSKDVVFILVYFVVGFIYMFLCLIISKDKTIGLYVMSIKLLGRDWNKPNMKIIILRSITSALPVLYIVNLLYMILYKTDETFFDEISESFIIQTGDNYRIEDK